MAEPAPEARVAQSYCLLIPRNNPGPFLLLFFPTTPSAVVLLNKKTPKNSFRCGHEETKSSV